MRDWYGFVVGVLGHAPSEFWRMSPQEAWAALDGFNAAHGNKSATPSEIMEAVREMEKFPAVITAEELERGG